MTPDISTNPQTETNRQRQTLSKTQETCDFDDVRKAVVRRRLFFGSNRQTRRCYRTVLDQLAVLNASSTALIHCRRRRRHCCCYFDRAFRRRDVRRCRRERPTSLENCPSIRRRECDFRGILETSAETTQIHRKWRRYSPWRRNYLPALQQRRFPWRRDSVSPFDGRREQAEKPDCYCCCCCCCCYLSLHWRCCRCYCFCY